MKVGYCIRYSYSQSVIIVIFFIVCDECCVVLRVVDLHNGDMVLQRVPEAFVC